jgi:hypothetical protein
MLASDESSPEELTVDRNKERLFCPVATNEGFVRTAAQ